MKQIETPMCPVCGTSTVMFVDEIAYDRWQSREILIQQAFPDMYLSDRELIKTGIHSDCWKILFTEEEE